MSARTRAFQPSWLREPEPFSSMNITPLIDVLLVLIVTLIMTIPMMTHKVAIDLPAIGVPGPIEPTLHRLDLGADGGLSLDGMAIAATALRSRLDAIRADPNAQLEFRADGAVRYERFDQTLATIKRAGITRLGFVGNEQFRNFDALP